MRVVQPDLPATGGGIGLGLRLELGLVWWAFNVYLCGPTDGMASLGGARCARVQRGPTGYENY
jgi:hypothetical protein